MTHSALDAPALDQLFRQARTYNAFSGDVSEQTLRELYDLMKFGPTTANASPARFVFVRSPEGKAKNAVSGAKRHAIDYLDLNYETDIAERERIFDKMTGEEAQLRKLPEKYKQLIRNETAFMDLLKQAHTEHDEALQREGHK